MTQSAPPPPRECPGLHGPFWPSPTPLCPGSHSCRKTCLFSPTTQAPRSLSHPDGGGSGPWVCCAGLHRGSPGGGSLTPTARQGPRHNVPSPGARGLVGEAQAGAAHFTEAPPWSDSAPFSDAFLPAQSVSPASDEPLLSPDLFMGVSSFLDTQNPISWGF